MCRLLPARLLGGAGGRKCDGGDACHHERRAADHLRVRGMPAAVQLAENENAPEKPPELIGVGKRNAATDAHIFCGVLLEEIADDPHEAAEHEPENDVTRTF